MKEKENVESKQGNTNNINNEISFDKKAKDLKTAFPEEKDALKAAGNNKELYAKYKSFKWKDPEKLKNGPLGDETRKCRDCICCLIFMIFIIGCFVIAILGFCMGQPKKILYSYDEDGNACGLENYTDYKMLYFYDVISNLEQFKLTGIVNAFCVKECPNKVYDKKQFDNKNITLECIGTKNNPNCTISYKNYYKSKSILNRFCFPDTSDVEEFNSTTQTKIEVYDYSKKANIQRIVEKDNVKEIDGTKYVKVDSLKQENNSKIASEQLINLSFFSTDRLINWISDIFVTKYIILASVFWSFIIAMIFLLLLRVCAAIIVTLILIGVFVGLVILAVFLRLTMYEYQEQADETKEVVFCVLFWICVVLAIIWLLFIVLMCNRIRLSIALIQIAAKYINTNCCVLCIPFIFFVITVIWIAYWIILSVYLYSTGDFDQENSKVIATFKWKYEIRYFWWYHLFALFYIDAFISAFSQFVYASCTSIWYFNHDKGTEGHFILKSFKRAFRYHLGSIAFGSLIIAIVRFIMFLFERFKKRMEKSIGKSQPNKCFKCVMCCIGCCLKCIEKVLEYINKHAYIMIAIKGDCFCTAAWEGFALTVRNLGRFSVLALLGKLFCNIGTLFITAASGIMGYLVIRYYGLVIDEIDSAFLPVFCMVMVGLIIGMVSMDVFGMSADTLLFCFLIDEEINKGQPKAMPELQKFMSDER